MENKSHAMAAGIFMLALACMLIGLALWLTRDQRQYTSYELSTTDAISGLQPQATVRYKGVAVGKVTHIGFDLEHNGHLLIRIAVDSEAPIHPGYTYAQLGYQGVTGIAHVQLDDENGPTPILPTGPSGLPRLPMKSSPLTVLADQGMMILSRADEAAERLNRLLGDANQERFSQLLDNLNHTAVALQQVSQQAEHSLQHGIDPVLKELPALVQDTRTSLQTLNAAGQHIGQLAEQLQAPEGVLAQLQVGTQSVVQSAQRFERYTLPGIQRATGDLGLASRQMGRTMANIDANPQSLIYGNGLVRPGPGEPGFTPPPVPAPAP